MASVDDWIEMSERHKGFAGPSDATTLPSPSEIADEVVQVTYENGHRITEVVVYGSYADGTQTRRSDMDVVAVSPDFEESHPIYRSFYLTGFWNTDEYPELDLVALRPAEFAEYATRTDHVVATAVDSGVTFSCDETGYPDRPLGEPPTNHAAP